MYVYGTVHVGKGGRYGQAAAGPTEVFNPRDAERA